MLTMNFFPCFNFHFFPQITNMHPCVRTYITVMILTLKTEVTQDLLEQNDCVSQEASVL
jgi:hypothetical protein